MKKVSVWMITYNHEKYLKQAIEGVLAQKTDFELEIVICDDASTDKTQEIIKKYAKKNPRLIKPYFHKKNIGMMRNMRFALEKCKSEYVALCEGDDYWTNNNKLSKQVKFLDENKEYSMAGHNVFVLNQKTGKMTPFWEQNALKDFYFTDAMKSGCGAPTCSLLIRRASLGKLPKWFEKCRSGDWPFHIVSLSQGKMFRDSEIMAVYRKHTTGSLFAATKKEMEKGNRELLGIQYKYTIETANHLDKIFKYKYSSFLDSQRVFAYLKISELNLLTHNFKEAKNNFFYAIKKPWIFTHNIFHWKLVYLFVLFLPVNFLEIIVKLKNPIK